MKTLSRILLWMARRTPRGYWRLARFAAQRDPALWHLRLPLRLIPGVTLVADLRESIFVQILRSGCFPHQAGEDRLFLHLLQSGDVVYDVGANIGYTPLLFAHAVGPSGCVHAFEPAPRAYRFLEASAAQFETIRAFPVALSDHEGEMDFFETEALDTSSLERIPDVPPQSVQIRTLDQMASQGPQPTFVKIDVEGHEPAVLRGMAGTLAREMPPFLVFEALSTEALQENLETLAELIRCPWLIYRIDHSGQLLTPDAPTGTHNYLALPANHRARLEGLKRPEPATMLTTRYHQTYPPH